MLAITLAVSLAVVGALWLSASFGDMDGAPVVRAPTSPTLRASTSVVTQGASSTVAGSEDAPVDGASAEAAEHATATRAAALDGGEGVTSRSEKRDPGLTLAWQPSHQGDTGVDGWKEYLICGDIVDRVIGSLPEFAHVKAWDTEHGLTGSNNYRPKPTNTKAFDNEIAMANEAKATAFISVHNDGGAPSGILGLCMPDDGESRRFVTALVDRLAEETGLPNRGVREVRLYSLEPERNQATYRCILEIGDNAADRAYLEKAGNRQVIAESIARGVRAYGLVE